MYILPITTMKRERHPLNLEDILLTSTPLLPPSDLRFPEDDEDLNDDGWPYNDQDFGFNEPFENPCEFL